MLRQLLISNYALIDTLDFRPGSGLSIITGETGAGKSIMLGALSLLLGERADVRVITDKEKRSTIEATFSDIDERTASKVRNLDAEWDGEEIILRREITPAGRSRAFVNDSPVTLAVLSDISRGMLDIHSQHSNAMLSESGMQLRLIDSVADNAEVLAHYREELRKFLDLRFRIRSIRMEAERSSAHREMIMYKLEQLDRLNPQPGEYRRLERQFDALSDAEDVRQRLGGAHEALAGAAGEGALSLIGEAADMLEKVDFSLWEKESGGEGEQEGENPGIIRRHRECYIEVKDIAETLESVMSDVKSDPAQLARISSRLQDYMAASRRFRTSGDDDLVELHRDLRRQLNAIDHGDSDIEELEREARGLARKLKEIASRLTSSRQEAAERLESEVEREARELGLPHLRFHVHMAGTKLGQNGGDAVEFQTAINKNQPLMAMNRVASGGEVARLMLAIKRVTSGRLQMPTVIFDEIDTGVSGEIADRMGSMMRAMGADMQILTITHLPQVAAKGERHFKVYKEDREDRTVSNVKLLDDTERRQELARMLSGRSLSEAALDNARSLLEG